MSMSHHYKIFGLTVTSPREIPSLAPVEVAPVAIPDVEIRFEDLAPASDPIEYLDMFVQFGADGLHIHTPGVARFQVAEGRRIVVAPEREETIKAALEYLLGTVMGALLHQRGMLPLHANVIEKDGRAFAFAGVAGAGKSTLAARLFEKGYGLLSDDICAVSWDPEGRPWAWPGIPRVKLWRDALEELAVPQDGLRPLSWTEDKFEIPIQSTCGRLALPLALVCDLSEEHETGPRGAYLQTGLDAADTLIAHTYRRRLADLQGFGARYLERILSLASAIPVVALRRRWGFDYFDEELRTIEGIMRGDGEAFGARLNSTDDCAT